MKNVANLATGGDMDSVRDCFIRTDDLCSQVLDKIAVSCRLQALLSSATACPCPFAPQKYMAPVSYTYIRKCLFAV